MLPLEAFGSTAQKLARNPLGIIALFIVLVYGIAAIVLGTSGDSLQPDHKTILVWFLVVFPCFVLAAFLWLVSRHHTKLYAPSDFRDDSGFLRTLSPQEQKAKLEEEVLEEAEAHKGIVPPIEGESNKSKNIRKSILLAEELVLRELENEFKTNITRSMAIGPEFSFDGLFAKDGQGYGVEIKYTSKKSPRSSIENVIQKVNEITQKAKWKRFNLIIAIVCDGVINPNALKKDIAPIIERSMVPVDLRFYSLEDLQDRYGVK